MEIKTNHMAVITPKMNLLQIPIKDKYYVPPSDPAALARATDFAHEKGLLNQHKTGNPRSTPGTTSRPGQTG
jgi:glutamine amidotransferase